MVNHANETGGVNGRKIEPVFHMVDVQSKAGAAALLQGTCAAFTQDQKVSLVLSGDNLGATYAQCLEKAGVAHIVFGGQSTANDKTFTTMPHYVEAGSLSLDRFSKALINALARQKYFDGAKKVGVLTYEDPTFSDTLKRTVLPELSKHHVEPLTAAVPLQSDDATRASQVASTVLKFKSAGVDRVVVIENNGLLKQLFMTSAAKQKYTPRYAMSSGGAQFMLSTVPAEQFKGSVGIGWLPHVDVPADKDPGTPGQKGCLDLLKSKGQQFKNRNAEGNALGFCDMFNLAMAALKNAGSVVNADTIIAGLDKVNDSVPPALVARTSFGPHMHDGVTEYRDLAFDDACKCFQYASDGHPIE